LVSNRCFPLLFSPCLRHLQADAPTFPPSDTGCPQRRGRRQLFRHGELLRRLGHPLAKSDGFLDGESQGYVQMVSFFLVLLSINGLLVSFFSFLYGFVLHQWGLYGFVVGFFVMGSM
jgi:hypothetical protein